MPEQAFTELIEAVYSELYADLKNHPQLLEVNPAPPSLDATVVTSLSRYAELLESWTTRVDLVAEADRETLVERHLLDSLAAWLIGRVIWQNLPNGRVLDVGSGAGLPGLVWAILDESRPVTLCEPREKRVIFLKEVRRQLRLPNVDIVQQRVEELSRSDVPQLAIVVSRALGDEPLLLEVSARLLAESGYCILMVGPQWQQSRGLQSGARPHPALQHLEYTLPRSKVGRGLAVWRFSGNSTSNI